MPSKTEQGKDTIILHSYKLFCTPAHRFTGEFFIFIPMKKSLIIFWGSVIFMLLYQCKDKTIHLGKEISYTNQEDLHYGNDTEQVLDLYMPKNKPKEQQDVFLIIHGGGWRGGNKSQLTYFTLSLMQKFPDAIFANMNYRLASASRFALPNQTDDIHKAILFLEKRLDYKPRFILLGNSAGGHLSMFYAYHSDKKKKVKAVINIVGPADLSDAGFKNYDDYSFLEKHLIDPETVQPDVSLMTSGSPVHWIRPTSAPTLSYYGTQDAVVPDSQGEILDSVLKKNHAYHELYKFNGDHVGWAKEPHDDFLIEKIAGFLKKIGPKKTL